MLVHQKITNIFSVHVTSSTAPVDSMVSEASAKETTLYHRQQKSGASLLKQTVVGAVI